MKAAKICCFALGTVLLTAALFLVVYNLYEDKSGGKHSEEVLAVLKQEIPEYIPEPEVMPTQEKYDLFAEYEKKTVPEMETIEADGNQYIGYITIPDINIELPVMADWSYPSLKISPCRYIGNLYNDDLIIAAHNYSSHFGNINSLNTGSEIIFTDVKGKAYHFAVVDIEQLSGTAVEDMQTGKSDEWDMTLFTCTLGGQSRVTVRAERTDK